MPEENTDNTQAQTTADGQVNNTENATQTISGTVTDTAAAAPPQTQVTQKEKTFTQAEVNAMISQRLPKAVKAELKKMAGDGEDVPDVKQLQQQLAEYQSKARSYETKDEIEKFLDS